eukprot:COSAG02_NODE_9032_length_2355_cov_1.647606_4_plen_381_part_01
MNGSGLALTFAVEPEPEYWQRRLQDAKGGSTSVSEGALDGEPDLTLAVEPGADPEPEPEGEAPSRSEMETKPDLHSIGGESGQTSSGLIEQRFCVDIGIDDTKSPGSDKVPPPEPEPEPEPEAQAQSQPGSLSSAASTTAEFAPADAFATDEPGSAVQAKAKPKPKKKRKQKKQASGKEREKVSSPSMAGYEHLSLLMVKRWTKEPNSLSPAVAVRRLAASSTCPGVISDTESLTQVLKPTRLSLTPYQARNIFRRLGGGSVALNEFKARLLNALAKTQHGVLGQDAAASSRRLAGLDKLTLATSASTPSGLSAARRGLRDWATHASHQGGGPAGQAFQRLDVDRWGCASIRSLVAELPAADSLTAAESMTLVHTLDLHHT